MPNLPVSALWHKNNIKYYTVSNVKKLPILKKRQDLALPEHDRHTPKVCILPYKN
jgi:hypothetical protein